MMTQPLTTEDILLADIETSPFQPRSKFKNKEFTAHSMSLLLYRSACGIVASCLRQTIGAKDPKQVDRRGTEVCGLLGLEYATLRDEAIQAIPYPKCWEKLNANGTPKVAKETKTAAATESTNSTTETPGTTKRGRPRKS